LNLYTTCYIIIEKEVLAMDVEYILLIIGSLGTLLFLSKLLFYAFTNNYKEEFPVFKLVCAESLFAFLAGLGWGSLICLAQIGLPIFVSCLGGVLCGIVGLFLASLFMFLIK